MIFVVQIIVYIKGLYTATNIFTNCRKWNNVNIMNIFRTRTIGPTYQKSLPWPHFSEQCICTGLLPWYVIMVRVGQCYTDPVFCDNGWTLCWMMKQHDTHNVTSFPCTSEWCRSSSEVRLWICPLWNYICQAVRTCSIWYSFRARAGLTLSLVRVFGAWFWVWDNTSRTRAFV